MAHELPNAASAVAAQGGTYAQVSASGYARQHNGNVVNHYANHYSLRQRRSDETLRDDQRSPLLLEAAADGQTDRINYLIRLGVNLDYRDDCGLTALHHAALSGFEDTVQALLDAGANINASATYYGTALCLAALKNRLNLVSLLLVRRARTSVRDLDGKPNVHGSALHCAVIGLAFDCVEFLLAQSVDVNQWCSIDLPIQGVKLDHLPAAFYRVNQLEYTKRQVHLLQPLHLAVLSQNSHMMEILFRAGASPNDRGLSQNCTTQCYLLTPLMIAAICGYVEGLTYLAARGADHGIIDQESDATALSCAAGNGHQDCAELLVKMCVNNDSTDSLMQGKALQAAIWNKQADCALLLLQRCDGFRGDIDLINSEGYTTLDAAVKCELNEVAQILARRGAKFNKQGLSSFSIIRLCNVNTFEYATFAIGGNKIRPPAFATLSHSFGYYPITCGVLKEMSCDERMRFTRANSNHGWFMTIHLFSECRAHGLEWAWADFLCVFEGSETTESELRDADTHMFQWHKQAILHLIYLHDFESSFKAELATASLFKTSGALRDLLSSSPEVTILFDKRWWRLGNRATLCTELGKILKMRAEHVLDHEKACVAARLSWGARLSSQDPEGRVYALTGVVGVLLERRSGEGEQAAFRRLQEAIAETYNDESIFAWCLDLGPRGKMVRLGLLAPSLDCFRHCSNVCIRGEGQKRFSLRREANQVVGVELTMPGQSLSNSLVVVVNLRCYDLESRRNLVPTALSLYMSKPGTWYRHANLLSDRFFAVAHLTSVMLVWRRQRIFVPHDP